MLLPAHKIIPLISGKDIQKRVAELGSEIENDYSDHETPLLLVAVLNGAAIFLADLVRSITRPLEFDFVAFSSYQAGTKSSGVVKRLKDIAVSPAGKHVIIIEDILDTGITLDQSFLRETLSEHGALSVAICVLLDKPSKRRVQVPIKYTGFTIPDEFVVGYGMDYANQYRALPYVGTVSFEINQTHSK